MIPKNATIKEILENIQEIKNDKINYDMVKANFKHYDLKTVTQMQQDYEKIYASLKRYSCDIIHSENVTYFLAKRNEIFSKELKLENEKKEAYIETLEKQKQDLKKEEEHKSEYIKVLENANQQKEQEIEALKEEIKQKNDTLFYYENMRLMKLIKKLKKKGN